MTATPSTTCPSCGAAASGKFCSACGAPLGEQSCASCGATLSAGAKFCHRCGAPRDATTAAVRPGAVSAQRGGGAPRSDRTAWIIAAVLTVVTIVAVIYAATKRSTPSVPVMANAGNAVPGATGAANGLGGNAPPIDQMTPKEQYSRLVARISRALQAGDTSTVINFTPMALGAYANLPPGDRDIEARYHAAMLQAQVGMFPNAKALADTIMRESPDNLFGYFIRAIVAGFAGDSTAAKAARAGFRAHYDDELKKKRPEYEANRALLEEYRKGDGAN